MPRAQRVNERAPEPVAEKHKRQKIPVCRENFAPLHRFSQQGRLRESAAAG
jgi:hypothetical protein